ncbi:MAG: DUF4384 domain-containing protein [Ignavibacteriales bacterium]|nr:DUF4384 domain-containing protein [Ignavibacteriales bacterium]
MKPVLVCFIAIALLVSTLPVLAQTQTTENIGFKWAFGSLVGKDRKFVSITKDTVLKTGDEIKLLVELTKDCYVYVLHYGSRGEVDLLFPYDLKQFDGDYNTGKNYYIPRGRSWIQLDKNTGTEKFYILASAERLVDLEAKIADYLSADASRKPSLASEVVTLVRDVRNRYKSFATLAEKPLTIGGNIRGTEKAEESRRPDVANIVSQVSASNFYSKTFTIDHQ